MAGLSFRVSHPDGRVEDLVVDSDRVLVGSGAHCEIRLPLEEAAVEHVLLSSTGAAIVAEARTLDPPPTIGGTPFAQAPLLPDAILVVGRTQITARLVEIGNQANVIRRKEEKTSPMTYVLAAIAVPISLFILLEDEPADETSGMPQERPALFATDAPRCAQASPVEARAFAQGRRRLAESKRERGPFHVQDAVAAVPLFGEAGACFEVAGDGPEAAEMRGAREKLEKQLLEDYHARQVRLEHALTVRDLKSAQREVRMLLGMLEGQTHGYVTWLASLDRRIALKLGKPESG